MKGRTQQAAEGSSHLDCRLAAYLATATTVGTALATEASAEIVGNNSVVPFGINEEVNIDFNSDGQIDFQIDHDRVDLGGTNLDYLQLDKNDINGASPGEMLLPIDAGATFPVNGTTANDTAESEYVVNGVPTTIPGDLGSYPTALSFGTPIGPSSVFDFQEGTNVGGTGNTIRANRLIDEDMTQIDQDPSLGNNPNVQLPFDGPNFTGLGGEVGYLGVKMDLNDTNSINYGWIGIRITNEADATGEVVGWAYENSGQPIAAGVIPEPTSIAMAIMGGIAVLCGFLWNRRWRR